MEYPILEMKNIVKTFGKFTALDDVSLTLNRGEVLGLVGENGAGKSTLLKILCGVHKMDSGNIFIKGQPVKITSVESAQSAGIGIIYQELSLVPSLNVAENIFIKKERTMGKKGGMLSALKSREMEKEAEEALNRQLGMNIDVRTPVERLKLGQRQVVEIARALYSNAEIIIMDEPTTALEQKERDKLFEVIRNLKKNGKSVIFVSHALEELLGICDKVLVLRDGRVVGQKETEHVNVAEVINLMIGKTIEQQYIKRKVEIGKELMRVENLSDGKSYKNISFTLHKGEVIGFAGLDGCGKNEVIRSLFGAHWITDGEIFKDGKKYLVNNPKEAIKNGVAFLPAERKIEGILGDQSVKWNTTIANLNRIKKIYLRKGLETNVTKHYVETMNIKTNDIGKPIRELSGGNQQKVLVARWLFTEPEIVIMEEPTRGIDVNSKTEIYEYIMRCVENEKGVLVVSSEVSELLGICDKILVMNKGRIVAELSASETTLNEITSYSVNL